MAVRYMSREVTKVSKKLTRKKFTQYNLMFKPFIFIISIWRSYFYDTTMYRNRGRSRDRPKGYSPDPTTLIILFMKDLSSPENGMYMNDPAMISFLLVN